MNLWLKISVDWIESDEEKRGSEREGEGEEEEAEEGAAEVTMRRKLLYL